MYNCCQLKRGRVAAPSHHLDRVLDASISSSAAILMAARLLAYVPPLQWVSVPMQRTASAVDFLRLLSKDTHD